MTKKKPGRGRPRLPQGETREIFSLRITPEERAMIESAAKASGEKASRWARNYLLSFARENDAPRSPMAERAGSCQCACS